jgi:hypothetical protein
MKILFAFVAILLLAGCNKPAPAGQPPAARHWEYRVEEVENYETTDAYNAVQEMKTNPIMGNARYELAQSVGGIFHFSHPPRPGSGPHSALDISALGAEGWELVSAIPQGETTYATDFSTHQNYPNVRTGKIILIFKRPIPN